MLIDFNQKINCANTFYDKNKKYIIWGVGLDEWLVGIFCIYYPIRMYLFLFLNVYARLFKSRSFVRSMKNRKRKSQNRFFYFMYKLKKKTFHLSFILSATIFSVNPIVYSFMWVFCFYFHLNDVERWSLWEMWIRTMCGFTNYSNLGFPMKIWLKFTRPQGTKK